MAILASLSAFVDTSCLFFRTTGQNKSSDEMLYIKWLTQTGSCDLDLRRAVLANGLVNDRGLPDSWKPIHLNNEHLNLILKLQLTTITCSGRVDVQGAWMG
jgi:hypothetical protein